MLCDEHSFNKYRSASYADSVPDTEDAINTPAMLLQRIYPKDLKSKPVQVFKATFIAKKKTTDITKLPSIGHRLNK